MHTDLSWHKYLRERLKCWGCKNRASLAPTPSPFFPRLPPKVKWVNKETSFSLLPFLTVTPGPSNKFCIEICSHALGKKTFDTQRSLHQLELETLSLVPSEIVIRDPGHKGLHFVMLNYLGSVGSTSVILCVSRHFGCVSWWFLDRTRKMWGF